MNNLDMLTAREQLMEDIDCIVESFWCDTWPSYGGQPEHYPDERDRLIKELCDAVCTHFPLQK